jgi:hypothetical protein
MRTVLAISVAVLSCGAFAWADELLAPRQSELERSLTRSDQLLEQARVFHSQLALAQSLFVSEGCATGACPPERAVQLIVDSQYAGHASRDLLQSSRSELARAIEIAAAPTVTPLLNSDDQQRIESLRRRTEGAMRGWLVRSAWYEDRMAPWAARWKAQIATACARPPGVEVEP